MKNIENNMTISSLPFGKILDNSVIPNYEHIEDLLYYDGPLLSVYQENSSTTKVLFLWMDVTDSTNIWAILNVSEEDILALKTNQITLLKVLNKQESFLTFETDSELNVSNVREFITLDFPKELLPSEDSYLNIGE